jgi:hypothetical protein
MALTKRWLSCFALPLLTLPALGQSTWYVDLNATPPGDGSPGSPYASIQYALDQPTTLPLDTVLVAPGTYVETIVFPWPLARLRSTAGPLATILMPGDPSDAAVVTLLRSSLLEGFTVTRTSSTADQIGIRLLECPQTSYIVRRCIVTGHGVGISGSYDLFVHDSTITGNEVGIDDACELIVYLRNSIAWGNATVDVRALLGVAATYCSIGTLDTFPPCDCISNVGDPRLWDAAGGDFHLRADSPCIDAGDPALQDPDGSRRDIGAVPYDPSWAPGTQAFCFGSAAACPCANGGSGEGGCDLPQGTGGVALAIEDFLPDGAGGGSAELLGSGYPPAAQPGVTLIRSPAAQDPPAVFGDGLRCISASGLVRIGAVLASGGTSLHTIGHGAGSGTFSYQLWTRSTPSTFCDPNAAFNLSNALEIVWP